MVDRLQRGTILPINHPHFFRFFSSLFQIYLFFPTMRMVERALKSEPTNIFVDLSLEKKGVVVVVVFCLTENLRSDKDKKTGASSTTD